MLSQLRLDGEVLASREGTRRMGSLETTLLVMPPKAPWQMLRPQYSRKAQT